MINRSTYRPSRPGWFFVTRGLAPAFFLSVLIGCGGGGGGDDAVPTGQPAPAPQGTSFTVSGKAIKGVIASGVVNVYVEGNLTNPIFVAPDLTGPDGSYTLTVPADAEFAGDMVVVEVVGNDEGTSTMICDVDLVRGCTINGETFAFGETVPIPAGFGIRAALVAPAEGESTVVHVNSLTEVVFNIASSGTLNVESLQRTNSQLAAILDLPGTDFSSVAGIDLSSSAARDGATATELKVALLSAALLGVALDNPGDLSEVFSDATGSLAAAVSAFVSDPENSSSLAADLAAALQRASRLARDVNQSELAADLFAEFTLAEAGELADLNPTPSPGAGLSGLEQAKLFVADLRNVRAAFREEELRNDFDPLQSAIDMAEEIASDATEDALRALFDVISAMMDAAEAYNDDTSLTSFVDENGIEITIVPGADAINAEFSVTELALEFLNSGTNTVSVTARAAGTSSSGDVLGDEFTFAGDLELTAMVANSRVTLDASEGFASIEGFEAVIGTQSASEFTARLSVVLAQVPAEDVLDPVTFEGRITASALDIAKSNDKDVIEDTSGTFDSLSAAFSGAVFTASDTVSVTLSVVADGADFFLGSAPPGTIFENAIEYIVEGNGKSVTIVEQDLERPDPTVSQSSRGELLTADEVQALGGLPDFFAAQPATYLGEALRIQTFDAQNFETTLAGLADSPFFFNADGVFLVPVEVVPYEFNNVVEWLNGAESVPEPRFTTFENLGVFEWVYPDGSFLIDGGFIDLELFCVGFCDIIDPDTGALLASFPITDRPSFQEDRQNVIRGVFTATDIIGIGDDTGVDISIAGEKLGLDTFEAGGNLSYAGRSFDLSSITFDIERLDDVNAITATNQDGIVIDLMRDDADFITGSIHRDGEEFATIEEDVGPGDVLLIRYTDGAIESL